MRIVTPILAVATALVLGTAGSGMAQGPPAYGPAITLEQATKVIAGAEAEAKKNNWPVAIVVLDSGGHIVALHRLDNTQFGSVEVARQKAWSAVAYRRPSKAFQDVVAGGGAGLRILGLEGASPIEGGLPLMADGKLVGAIGVSGVTGEQDSQIAAAGVAALK
jgi:glc operon protein GlcG